MGRSAHSSWWGGPLLKFMDSLEEIIKCADYNLRHYREEYMLELIIHNPLKDDSVIYADLLGMLDPGQRSQYL